MKMKTTEWTMIRKQRAAPAQRNAPDSVTVLVYSNLPSISCLLFLLLFLILKVDFLRLVIASTRPFVSFPLLSFSKIRTVFEEVAQFCKNQRFFFCKYLNVARLLINGISLITIPRMFVYKDAHPKSRHCL